MLEEVFARRVGESAEYFARSVGEFLEANGVAGEKEAIRKRFMEIYERRKASYQNFIASNPDCAGVERTEDEWLLTAGDIMGRQLRYALNLQNPEMNLSSAYGYSIDDLQAFGTLVKELSALQDQSCTSNRSEEELGIQLGIAAMK